MTALRAVCGRVVGPLDASAQRRTVAERTTIGNVAALSHAMTSPTKVA
ncbi:hypothetical protein BLAT2472_20788 [Burkholderia latens]